MKTGIQLYTVRETLKDDFKGTLRKLAEIGYGAVEFAWNYGGMTPEQLAGFLDECTLACCGMHMPLDALLDVNSEHYRYANAVNAPCVTVSLAGRVATDWENVPAELAQGAAIAAGHGLSLTYHNHAQELAAFENTTALDWLYAHTAPELVKAELDTYWLAKGGGDPVAYVSRYAGRQPQLHLKDMDREDGSFAEVGTGTLDFPAIIAAAQAAGVEWLIVEQDKCKRAALDSAAISLKNINGLI
ncbi:MAG: sugar phosphate isomerase/epimerase [Candidatus Marinimicrobia bacterium]|nr:sugar phosphate isomerase/epimerase [Candidatus Neomarinimicrobiota bacterium]